MEPLVSGRVQLSSVVVEETFLNPLVSRMMKVSLVVVEETFLNSLVDPAEVEETFLDPLVDPVVGSVKALVAAYCPQMALSIVG